MWDKRLRATTSVVALTSRLVVLAGDDAGDQGHGDDAEPHKLEKLGVAEARPTGERLTFIKTHDRFSMAKHDAHVFSRDGRGNITVSLGSEKVKCSQGSHNTLRSPHKSEDGMYNSTALYIFSLW